MAAEFNAGTLNIALADTGVAAGDIASVANPEGVPVHITRCILYLTTASTGASTLDIGVGSGASTSYDNLIDGVSGAAAGAFDNLKDAGSNGKGGQLWAAANYVTASEASGDTTGLEGYLCIEYVTLPS